VIEQAGSTPANELAVEPFQLTDLIGELVSSHRPADLATELARLTDPQAAGETVHWGRNYLYRANLQTPGGRLAVVVKQFPNSGWRERWRRRRGEDKARRSWRMALAFAAAGIATAEPLMLAESRHPEGPSFFITRDLGPTVEARHLLLARNAGSEAKDFPQVDFVAYLQALGRAARRLHDRGLFHRDLSIGNVLTPIADGKLDLAKIYLVDLNRARRRQHLGVLTRSRDLCRLEIFQHQDQQVFLDAYWGQAGVVGWRWFLYQWFHRSFRFKIRFKKALRGRLRKLRDGLSPRRPPHGQMPAAPASAGSRDKAVWDRFSDQPHQHAGRLEKLTIRLSDLRSHLGFAASLSAAAPRIWRRYRQLQAGLYRQSLPWQGAGICLRPAPEAEDQLLQAVEDLGVHHVLLRLHPWEDDHQAELELASELHRRGFELTFALPQNRDLVRDPARWRARLEQLSEQFIPFGRTFQIGQAPNRSKWGVWRYGEYLHLAEQASEVLRAHPGVELVGPAVIDFEFHVTAALVNAKTAMPPFDALASLLYVDRRGAPENSQLGFDTVDKLVLAQAIADTAKGCSGRSWITEVNWPLREGPHSPAGREVAVDESAQADYLVRYYLLALTSGCAERVYWWQLVAQGYGLIAVAEKGAPGRRRPAFAALATLERQLAGSTFQRRLASPPRSYLLLFAGAGGGEVVVGWSVDAELEVELPWPAEKVLDQQGEEVPLGTGRAQRLGASVSYCFAAA